MTYDFDFQFPTTQQIQDAIYDKYSQIPTPELCDEVALFYCNQVVGSFYNDYCEEQSFGNEDYILDWWSQMEKIVQSLWPDYFPQFPPVEPLPF